MSRCDRCGGNVLFDGYDLVCAWCGERPNGYGRIIDRGPDAFHLSNPWDDPLYKRQKRRQYAEKQDHAAYQRAWRAGKRQEEMAMNHRGEVG